MGLLDSLLGGAVGVGGNLLGNYLGNQYNQQNIQQQEDFQNQMSSTAYQRASRDMIAAGINPIMAYGHPASAPSGGAAQMGSMNLGDAAISGASAAQGLAKTQVDTENAIKQGDQITATTQKVDADRLATIANTARTYQDYRLKLPDELKTRLDAQFLGTDEGKAYRIQGNKYEEAGRGGTTAPVTSLGIDAGIAAKQAADRASKIGRDLVRGSQTGRGVARTQQNDPVQDPTGGPGFNNAGQPQP